MGPQRGQHSSSSSISCRNILYIASRPHRGRGRTCDYVDPLHIIPKHRGFCNLTRASFIGCRQRKGYRGLRLRLGIGLGGCRVRWQELATYHWQAHGSRLVQWAGDAAATLVQNVGVDHRRFNAGVAKQFLHGPDVVASFDQVCREEWRISCAWWPVCRSRSAARPPERRGKRHSRASASEPVARFVNRDKAMLPGTRTASRNRGWHPATSAGMPPEAERPQSRERGRVGAGPIPREHARVVLA